MTTIDPRVFTVLEQLPLAPDALAAAIRAAGIVDARGIEFVRRANDHAADLAMPATPSAALRDADFEPGPFVQRLLLDAGRDAAARLESGRVPNLGGVDLKTALGPVPAPLALRTRAVLDACYAAAADDAAARLRAATAGDCLAAIRRSVPPAAALDDVDWAAAALEHLEAAGQVRAERVTFGERPRTPGWLWARIRGDVRGRVIALHRRRAMVRTALAAAALLVTALVAVAIDESIDRGTGPVIVFESLDRPPAELMSTAALVRRLRDDR